MSEHEDFIRVFPQTLSLDQCRGIVELFERSPLARPGLTGGGLRPDLKRSLDIRISGRHEWRPIEELLHAAVFDCLKMYVRELPHALLGSISLEAAEPGSGSSVAVRTIDVSQATDVQLNAMLTTVLAPGPINLQKYEKDKGGYPHWHSETYPSEFDSSTLRRVLFWTLYLNDEFTGGETEFFHQSITIAPETGAMLVAPAYFTHAHRGNVPKDGDKFIATGWIQFLPPEAIFSNRRL